MALVMQDVCSPASQSIQHICLLLHMEGPKAARVGAWAVSVPALAQHNCGIHWHCSPADAPYAC